MTALIGQSERIGYSTLYGEALNINGDQALAFELPEGYGECLIWEWHLSVYSVATMMTTPNLFGPRVTIVSTADNNERDFLDGDFWRQTSATRVDAFSRYRRSAYLRIEESISIGFSEVDTNASPTADLLFLVRVVRLRP